MMLARLLAHSVAVRAVMFVVLLCCPASALAIAPGAPDPSFGAGGVISPKGLRVAEVFAQPDGGLLVLGTRGISTPWRTVLHRRLPDGSQDRSFGGGGGEVFIETPRIIGPASFSSAWQYDDGRILLMGWTSTASSADELDAWEERVVIGRLLPDGRPDTTFSRDGFFSIDAAVGGPEEEVIPEIRPVVDTADPSRLGFEITTSTSTALTVFDGAGRLDTGFAEDGSLVVDVAAIERQRGTDVPSGGNALGWSMAPGGGWFLAARSWRGGDRDEACTGSVCPLAEPERFVQLHRYTAAGTLDPAFGVGGIARVADPGAGTRGEWYDDFPADLVVLDDGRLLTIEEAAYDGSTTITRWRPDGTLDPTWSGDGQSGLDMESLGGNSLSVVHALPDAAGRLVVSLAGWRSDDARFARLTQAGEIDPSFDLDGSWLPLTRARQSTSEFGQSSEAPFTLDARGRIIWWADLGEFGCCPWRGLIDDRIGVLAGGDAASLRPTLDLAVAGRRCGGSRRLACVASTLRGIVVTGRLTPVPPAGQRAVYVSVFDCEGERHAVRGVRVGADGSFRQVLAAERDGAEWRVVARREPSGDMQDVVSRTLFVRRARPGPCEL